MFTFNDKKLAKQIVDNIKKLDVNYKFMHVCGTHQDALLKNGLDVLLKDCGIEIGQGPGCPVCVTTQKEIEEMILLAQKGITVTTFGDMINVPGEKQSLQNMKTEGYDIRAVYSISDAVSIAENNKNKEVVFMAVGFETTAPTTASILLNKPTNNFSILCCHRTIPNALKALLDMGEIKIDGLIEPGHVSTIIGSNAYNFISNEYNVPQVITGFEAIDILMAVWMLIKQIQKGEAFVENEYTRAVKKEGNIKAQNIINKVFKTGNIKWRGFPIIPNSSLILREDYDTYNARIKYKEILQELKNKKFKEPKGCKCSELLRGLLSPKDCLLFSKECTPENPIGPCMVSIEGSCNIEYRYSFKKN